MGDLLNVFEIDDTPIVTYAPRVPVHTIETYTPVPSGVDPGPYIEPAPWESRLTTVPAPPLTSGAEFPASLPSWVWIAGGVALFMVLGGKKGRR